MRDILKAIGVVLIIVGAIGLLIFAVVEDCKARKECEATGGQVVTDYARCTPVTTCHTVGKSTVCTTSNYCPWVCQRSHQ